MAYLPHDLYIGRSLDLYGEFSQGEVDLYQRIIKKGDVVVEAGANIGALTVPLARLAGTNDKVRPGTIFAFEPQRLIYQLLNANLALNGLQNVYAERVAIGQKTGKLGVPVINYNRAGNFGGYSLVDANHESVIVVTIDSLHLRRLDFIKIDVEGMEAEVLLGAKQTIAYSKPVIYCENDRKENSAHLMDTLTGMGYKMYWHLTPLFNKDNFGQHHENVFGAIISANMLCLPSDTKVDVKCMPMVTGPDDWWERPDK